MEALEAKTEHEIQAIKADFEANKEKVVELLLKNVMEVDIEIPKVVKGNFEWASEWVSDGPTLFSGWIL